MSRFIIIISLIFFFNPSIKAQEDLEKLHLRDKTFAESIENFTLNYFYAQTMGSNFINDAQSFNYGIAAELHFKTYKNFYVGGGANHASYSVFNKELVGNYSKTIHTSIYISMGATFNVADKICVFPQIGYGYTYLAPKKDGVGITKQDGDEFRIGSKIIYNLTQDFGFFMSVHYVYDSFNVSANPAVEDFYNHSQSINFGLGITFY